MRVSEAEVTGEVGRRRVCDWDEGAYGDVDGTDGGVGGWGDELDLEGIDLHCVEEVGTAELAENKRKWVRGGRRRMEGWGG